MAVFDVLVIGGGVVGCAVLRELSRYRKLTIGLVEKESDVARGMSGRNSGVVHAGFNVRPGTLKARLNVEGRGIFAEYCRELGVPYEEVGKLVVAKTEEEISHLEKLKRQGEENGTADLRMVDQKELSRIEPNIAGIAALHSPRSAITCPFTLTTALAENAMRNGASIFLDTEVTAISQHEWGFAVDTAAAGALRSSMVVNSAGIFSADVAGMVGINGYRTRPCRGEYHVLDKRARSLVNGLVYPVPLPASGVLGIHITPTVDGNLMLGPSAEYIDDCEDTANTATVMEKLYREAAELMPKIRREHFIRSFSGIRMKLTVIGSGPHEDFVIEESDRVPGFVNLIGIESPGLTSSPAIAKMVAGIIGNTIELEPRPDFNPVRHAGKRFSHLPEPEKAELVRRNPAQGTIICRCETVTRQEVLDAINNPLGARTLNGIKMRCRAGMGRCQGGFCSPRIVEILEKEFGMSVNQITLMGRGSELFAGRTKDLLRRKKGGDGKNGRA